MRSLILPACLIVCLMNAAQAEVSLGTAEYGYPILISGAIEKGDFQKVETMSRKIVNSGNEVVFHLNSSGGDLAEAIRIGQFVKKLSARTELNGITTHDPSEANTKCYSACFIIFVSGSIRGYRSENLLFDQSGNNIVKRTPIIGIHRPYFDQGEYSKLTADQARIDYQNLSDAVRTYLESVSVSTEIVDEMFAHSSTEIRYISKEEYDKKIGGKQPFFEEWLIAQCGQLTEGEMDDLATVLAEQARYGDSSLIPKGMSAGYIEYLDRKLEEGGECDRSATFHHQEKILNE